MIRSAAAAIRHMPRVATITRSVVLAPIADAVDVDRQQSGDGGGEEEDALRRRTPASRSASSRRRPDGDPPAGRRQHQDQNGRQADGRQDPARGAASPQAAARRGCAGRRNRSRSRTSPARASSSNSGSMALIIAGVKVGEGHLARLPRARSTPCAPAGDHRRHHPGLHADQDRAVPARTTSATWSCTRDGADVAGRTRPAFRRRRPGR